MMACNMDSELNYDTAKTAEMERFAEVNLGLDKWCQETHARVESETTTTVEIELEITKLYDDYWKLCTKNFEEMERRLEELERRFKC